LSSNTVKLQLGLLEIFGKVAAILTGDPNYA